jgi:hypothetical protein
MQVLRFTFFGLGVLAVGGPPTGGGQAHWAQQPSGRRRIPLPFARAHLPLSLAAFDLTPPLFRPSLPRDHAGHGVRNEGRTGPTQGGALLRHPTLTAWMVHVPHGAPARRACQARSESKPRSDAAPLRRRPRLDPSLNPWQAWAPIMGVRIRACGCPSRGLRRLGPRGRGLASGPASDAGRRPPRRVSGLIRGASQQPHAGGGGAWRRRSLACVHAPLLLRSLLPTSLPPRSRCRTRTTRT